MWGFSKIPLGRQVWCGSCGQPIRQVIKQADEVLSDDGARKTLENLQVIHQPCGCIWSPAGWLVTAN